MQVCILLSIFCRNKYLDQYTDTNQSARNLVRRKKEVRARLQDAENTLRSLESPVGGYRGYDPPFFENLWILRKSRQLDVMNEEKSRKREMIAVLLGLEEELIGAR